MAKKTKFLKLPYADRSEHKDTFSVEEVDQFA